MADISISKFTTQIPRVGATPATPGFAESEGQDPVAPSGTPQVYTPVTIGSPANGLSISGTQVLTIGLASTSTTGALSSTDWNTFNGKIGGSGTTNYIPKFTGSGTIGDSAAIILGGNLSITETYSSVILNNTTSGSTIAIGGDMFTDAYVGTTTNHNFSFISNGLINAVLTTSGNLLIGTTTDSGFKLQVGNLASSVAEKIWVKGQYNIDGAYLGKATVNGGATLELLSHSNVSTSSAFSIRHSIDEAPNVLRFMWANSSATYAGLSYVELMRLTGESNLIIGTTTDTGQRLQVSGETKSTVFSNVGVLGVSSTNARNHFTQYNAGNAGISSGWIASAFGDTSGSRVVIGQADGLAIVGSHNGNLSAWANLDFASINYIFRDTSLSPLMTLNSSGNLLIGTTNDSGHKLNVNGEARIQTINNLGVSATSVLVPSATGVISLRTLAELASDGGFLSNTIQTVSTTGTINNLAKTGTTIIFTGSSSVTLTGLQAGTDGEEIRIVNYSSALLTIAHEDTGSTDVNRIRGKVSLGRFGMTAILKYRTTQNRWILITGFWLSDTVNGFYSNNNVGIGTNAESGRTLTLRSATNTSASNGLFVTDQSGNQALNVTGTRNVFIPFQLSVGTTATPIANVRLTLRGSGTGTNTNLRLEDSGGNLKVLFLDNGNIQFDTTTGTKIGTATNQRLAFWNKTPIVQPTNAIGAGAFVANTSGIANDTATYGGYTMGQIAQALINVGILA